jgi:hypothetical protein
VYPVPGFRPLYELAVASEYGPVTSPGMSLPTVAKTDAGCPVGQYSK